MKSPPLGLTAHAFATCGTLVAITLRRLWSPPDVIVGWLVMLAIALSLSLVGELGVRRIRAVGERLAARYLLVAAVALVLVVFRQLVGWPGLAPLLLAGLAGVTAVKGLAIWIDGSDRAVAGTLLRGAEPALSGAWDPLRTQRRVPLPLAVGGAAAAVSFVVWYVWQDGGTHVKIGVVAAVVTACWEAAFRSRVLSPAMRPRLCLLAGTLLVLLVSIEIGLRFGTNRYTTWAEKNGAAYRSAYEPGHSGWLWVQNPNTRFFEEKPEFTHEREINSLGLTGEFTMEKGPAEYRILALGDSFTEGVGAPIDATWLKVLERELAPRLPDRRVTTLNAGVSGSDLFYEYMLLKDRLLPYQPDLVIVALNSSDIIDVIARGGVERFRPGGTVAYRAPPAWEPLYQYSYLTRVVVHDVLRYNWLLFSNEQLQIEERLAAEHLEVAVGLLRELCRSKGIPLVIVVHPQPAEIVADGWGSLADLVRRPGRETEPHVVDLLEHYRRGRLITAQTVNDYFWPIDGHHNRRGYEVMGKAIADEVVAFSVLPGSSAAP